MTITQILNQYDFNLKYAKALVNDVSDEEMTQVPADGLVNHPAWTLGHLVTGSALLIEDLGGVLNIPEGWSDLFLRRGPGDPRLPESDIHLYPAKDDLLRELEKQHEEVKKILIGLNENDLSKEIKWRFHEYMPTIGDLILFFCINHESMHLGQLAAWRRAMNLPSALAAL